MGPATTNKRLLDKFHESSGLGKDSEEFASVADWKSSSDSVAWVRLCEKGDLSRAFQELDSMSRRGLDTSQTHS